jgi:phosphoenolpyruvate phosphomutase
VVARIEAFIAGWGLQEAVTRAEAYRNAGADAVLIHSNKTDPSDIEAFMSQWGNKVRNN